MLRNDNICQGGETWKMMRNDEVVC